MRTTGRLMKLLCPFGNGTPYVNQALTLSPTKTISGIEYINRFYGLGNTIWNRFKPITTRIQGILGAIDIISGTGGNDTAQTKAFKFYKDAGAEQTSAVNLSIALTRPAVGKYNWNLICITLETGIITVEIGSDGAAYSDIWGAAGGPPLIPTTKLIIGAVKLFSNVPAPIAAGIYNLSDGILIQERTDNPSYDRLPIEGGLLAHSALLPCHVGNITRGVYATFYDFDSVMTNVGHIETFNWNASSDTVSSEAANDLAPQTDLSGPTKWTGSFSRFYVADAVIFEAACNRRFGVVKHYPNPETEPTKYFMGCVILTGFDQPGTIKDFLKNTVTFIGDGHLKPVGF